MGRANGKPPPEGASAGEQRPLDFSAQFEASFRTLWLVAVGITGDRGSAEDVVQEAALLALGKLDKFEPGTNFRAWMAQMVRYVALNHARKRQKHRAATLGPELEETGALASSDAAQTALRLGRRGELPADQAFFDDQVIKALNSVSDVARACLLLRTLEQMEYSEISKVLGIPEGTAMSHVHRARQHLRERLADKGPASPGDATMQERQSP
ncbi:MAG TPA: RNA polymerase sigma factor [Tepidisphaeraceae bacterium]|nr:RNA polymerase sigma factor [Tepidisphaeraceae bacterium]